MELAPRLACCPSGASPPSQDATTARQAACCTRRSMIAGRAGASPTQGTVAAGELVSEGFTDLRTDLPRQRNDGDRHASDAAADSHARGAGFAPLEAVRRPRARPQQQPRRSATTTTALARTAPAAPPHGVNGSRNRPAVGAGRLRPVGDAIEAVRVDEVRALRCTVCSQRLAAYDEDYKRACLMRELPLDTGVPSNAECSRSMCCASTAARDAALR